MKADWNKNIQIMYLYDTLVDLLDSDGNPISRGDNKEYYRALLSALEKKGLIIRDSSLYKVTDSGRKFVDHYEELYEVADLL